MKKTMMAVPLVAAIMTASLLNACGNGNKTHEEETIVKEIKYNKEDVEKVLKAFLLEYINPTNDNLYSFLSEDYKEVIKKWELYGDGEWDMFGLASAERIEKYTILCMTEPKENRAAAKVKLLVESEESYEDYIVNIHLKLEKDRWVVDEIGELKLNMKFYLIENGKE